MLLAMRALDIGRGDEVITTPFTFFATAGTIHNVGATPVFVDIEPQSFNIAPSAIAAAITSKTKAIIPVDLFGQMAAIEKVTARCQGIPVIEDAAQIDRRAPSDRRRVAHGRRGRDDRNVQLLPVEESRRLWRRRNDRDAGQALATRLRRLRVHGGAKQYFHDEVGYNSRLDALQAAVLSAKLPHLAGWSAKRRENARYYTEALCGIDGCLHAVDRSEERVDLQSVHDSRRATRRAAGVSERNADRHGDLLSAAAAPAALLRVPRLPGRELPGVGASGEGGAVVCRFIPS